MTLEELTVACRYISAHQFNLDIIEPKFSISDEILQNLPRADFSKHNREKLETNSNLELKDKKISAVDSKEQDLNFDSISGETQNIPIIFKKSENQLIMDQSHNFSVNQNLDEARYEEASEESRFNSSILKNSENMNLNLNENEDIPSFKDKNDVLGSTNDLIEQISKEEEAQSEEFSESPENLEIISIEIPNFRVIKENFISKTFAYYQVNSAFQDLKSKEKTLYSVERRFSDFEWIVKFILSVNKYQGILCPRLPEKDNISAFISSYVGNNNQLFERRQYELEKFLLEIKSSAKLKKEKVFWNFLRMKTDDFRDYKKKNKSIIKHQNSLFQVKMDFQHMIDYAQAYVKTQFNELARSGSIKREFVN